MSRAWIPFFFATWASASALTAPAHARGGMGGMPDGDPEAAAQKALENFGLEAFADPKKVFRFVLKIVGAASLGWALAYLAPRSKISIEDLDLPKIVITYTVVGALVAICVETVPSLGWAIFGIGGLMRFRTELGAAKETGRVILATILGIACGINLWMVAIVTTVLALILINILESGVHVRMVVRGLRTESVGLASESYGNALLKMKCSFSAPRKNPGKGQVSFILQHRRRLSPEDIEARLNAEIPKELRGTIDWPED